MPSIAIRYFGLENWHYYLFEDYTSGVCKHTVNTEEVDNREI
jgi:hypothetical protein